MAFLVLSGMTKTPAHNRTLLGLVGPGAKKKQVLAAALKAAIGRRCQHRPTLGSVYAGDKDMFHRLVVIDQVTTTEDAQAILDRGGHLMYVLSPGKHSWLASDELDFIEPENVSAVIGLHTGTVFTSPERFELIPKRPWWVRFNWFKCFIRGLFGPTTPSDVGTTSGTVPGTLAYGVASAWFRLITAAGNAAGAETMRKSQYESPLKVKVPRRGS